MRCARPVRASFIPLVLLLAAGTVPGQTNRWESIGQMPMYGGNQGVFVYGIAFGPDGTLFAANSLGVYKSTGDGVWKPALLVPRLDGSIPPDYAFFSILAQPGSPDTMLAGLSVGGVYRTTDGGQTWTSGGLGGAGFLSMANGSASPQVAYASVTLVGSAATYRSDNGGATWNALPALGPSPVRALAVDPTSSDVVFGYVGASSAGLPAGAYRSTDGGGAWSRLSGGLADDAYTAFAVDPVTPGTVYAGSNDNGVFRSDDGGGNWFPIDEGLGSLQVRQIVIDPTNPSLLYAGTMGGIYRSADRGGHWSSVGFHQENISSLALDPASPSTLYAGIPADLARITLAPPEPCAPGPEALCLNGGRFRVEAVWRGALYSGGVSSSAGGVGQASPITDDTGSFWFFDAANLELAVKVLDGSGVNGDFWVFYGGLTNLEYIITVTDTEAGIIQSYYYVGGTFCPANAPCPLASVADTEAFPGASATASSAPVTSPAAPVASAAAAAGLCVPDAQTLCELGGRFQVRVEFQGSPTGPTRTAPAVPLTDDTGYFWFFDAANIELVVKTLDGTTTNGHYWVFSGALSDVHYTITVTDLETGAVQTYQNPFGQLASFADTSAF